MRKLLAIMGIMLVPGAAMALEAKVERTAAADAKTVWAAVGDFCGISKWHPAVAKCELSEKDGRSFRLITLKDGAKLYERLESFDKDAMSYSYIIVDSPLPVKNYVSTLTVKASGNGSAISWGGNFDANNASDADAVKTMTGVYEAGVVELAKTK